MSLAKASLWTAASTLVKIGAGLLVVKLLAVNFGPEGLGLAGNYRQLLTILGVLAGAGIFNGVTKYLAEYQDQPDKVRVVIGTSSLMVFGFSMLLAVTLFVAAVPISQSLFGDANYYLVIRVLAFTQMGIAYGNLFLAILRGYRDARANALGIIGGSVLGVLAYWICASLGGYQNALIGLGLMPALLVLPAAVLLFKCHRLRWGDFRWYWERAMAAQLGRFTLMVLITTVTLPLAYVMMRNLLATHYSWHEVGIWQGVSTISDAYLQFITASFTVYLLPTLSRLKDKRAIGREISQTLRFVLPVVASASFGVWLLRDLAIWLLFTAEFTAMRELFAWQLLGDVLKVGAYVYGYLVIAKASLRFYLLAEVTQFLLLILFSQWLIPLHGALGAVQAYMATYIVYFALCSLVFLFYRRWP